MSMLYFFEKRSVFLNFARRLGSVERLRHKKEAGNPNTLNPKFEGFRFGWGHLVSGLMV